MEPRANFLYMEPRANIHYFIIKNKRKETLNRTHFFFYLKQKELLAYIPPACIFCVIMSFGWMCGDILGVTP